MKEDLGENFSMFCHTLKCDVLITNEQEVINGLEDLSELCLPLLLHVT